ncbi:MAG: hypothetical protein ACJ75B_03555 [Flavisolibacter sp.]
MKTKKTGKPADKNITSIYTSLVQKLLKEKKMQFITPALFTRQ